MGIEGAVARPAALRTPIFLRFTLRGNPSREIAGVSAQSILLIMCTSARSGRMRSDATHTVSGGAMDLAMAMSVALFGMFTGSTIYFFYKVAR